MRTSTRVYFPGKCIVFVQRLITEKLCIVETHIQVRFVTTRRGFFQRFADLLAIILRLLPGQFFPIPFIPGFFASNKTGKVGKQSSSNGWAVSQCFIIFHGEEKELLFVW